jgi:hypothetical protein
MEATLVLWVWCIMAAWFPALWLFVLPATLPFLNFAPWTGWLVFDEFDLLLWGTLAGGYGRWALEHREPVDWAPPRLPGLVPALQGLLGIASLWALHRGFEDAGGFAFDWFAGYGDALNSVRVFKSLGFALLLLPLLRREFRHSTARASQRLAGGMVTGLGLLTLAVVWERAAFVGLLDFSSNYRTVGLFWEMHVGGAAIDSYLALTSPFVVWALVSARRRLAWVAAAVLALLAAYACLTTFSRGVYLSVMAPLGLLAILLWRQRHAPMQGKSKNLWWEGWRAKGSVLLVFLIALEVAAVLGAGSFMAERVAKTSQDLGSRMDHWQRGMGLLQGPVDWWLGKGLGRLPGNYAAKVPQEGFSGVVELHSGKLAGQPPNGFVSLRSAENLDDLGGSYALTQRVQAESAGGYRVSMAVRVQEPTDLYVALCERHLLYDRACQDMLVTVLPGKTAWQTMAFPLRGPPLDGGTWYAPRMHMFEISVASPGGAADIDNLGLTGDRARSLLENGDFSRGLAQWFPAAQSYFLPWHIDNLYLEVLIERGLVGLLLLGALISVALWHLSLGRARARALSPFLAASLAGLLVVGMVSSVMDVPRVAFLFFLLLFASTELARHPESEPC